MLAPNPAGICFAIAVQVEVVSPDQIAVELRWMPAKPERVRMNTR
jgi:hypothetical protein